MLPLLLIVYCYELQGFSTVTLKVTLCYPCNRATFSDDHGASRTTQAGNNHPPDFVTLPNPRWGPYTPNLAGFPSSAHPGMFRMIALISMALNRSYRPRS